MVWKLILSFVVENVSCSGPAPPRMLNFDGQVLNYLIYWIH